MVGALARNARGVGLNPTWSHTFPSKWMFLGENFFFVNLFGNIQWIARFATAECPSWSDSSHVSVQCRDFYVVSKGDPSFPCLPSLCVLKQHGMSCWLYLDILSTKVPYSSTIKIQNNNPEHTKDPLIDGLLLAFIGYNTSARKMFSITLRVKLTFIWRLYPWLRKSFHLVSPLFPEIQYRIQIA